MKVSTLMLLASLGMFVPSALMWRMARRVSADASRFLNTALPATGTVVRLEWRVTRTGADTRTDAYPEVAFTLPDGQKVQAIARTGRFPRPAEEGDVVEILYDPSDPQQIDLASQAPRSVMTMGYRFLAVSFAVMGLGGLILWWLLFRLWGIPA